MKHIVLTMLLLYLGFFQTIKSQTLHAIVFANTECPGEKPGSLGIGPSVTCDYQRMKIEFETMASFLGYKKDFQCIKALPISFAEKR